MIALDFDFWREHSRNKLLDYTQFLSVERAINQEGLGFGENAYNIPPLRIRFSSIWYVKRWT